MQRGEVERKWKEEEIREAENWYSDGEEEEEGKKEGVAGGGHTHNSKNDRSEKGGYDVTAVYDD